MIIPLLIARKENAGILKNISDVDFLSPRTQIGSDWSLKLFIQSDLRNYTLQTHFILDISSFVEKGDEFIELLDGIIFHNEEAHSPPPTYIM